MAYKDLVLASVPLAYWRMDDGTLSTNNPSLVDSGPNNWKLTPPGTWYVRQYGNWTRQQYGMYSGGSGFRDDVTTHFSFEKNQPFSFQFWWCGRGVAAGASGDALCGKRLFGTTYRGYDLIIYQGYLRWQFIGDNTVSDFVSRCYTIPANFLTKGVWTHVAVTYDGSNTRSGMKLYLNGVLQTPALEEGSNNSISSSIVNTTPFSISSLYNNYSTTIGAFADFAAYDRELGASEITGFVTYTRPPISGVYINRIKATNPDAWWRLDEGVPAYTTDMVFLDATGNERHLSTYGSANATVQKAKRDAFDYQYAALIANGDVYSQCNDSVFVREYNQPFSFQTWFYVNQGFASGSLTLFSKATNVGTYPGYYADWTAATSFRVSLANSWSSSWMSSTFTVPDIWQVGSWHHVAVTYDGSGTWAGIRVFFDGLEQTNRVDVGSSPFSASILVANEFSIGGYGGGTGALINYDGNRLAFADAAWYRRALTPTEVASLGTFVPSWPARSVGNSTHVLRSAARPAKNLRSLTASAAGKKKRRKINPGVN